MSQGLAFMDWLNINHPDLYEIFSVDGIFIEKKADHHILHITLVEEDISLQDLNRLQTEWNNFIQSEAEGEEASPLVISQNKF